MSVAGLTDLGGRVLIGRYRLLQPIGAGGGGRVYLGDDVKLRRRVAVKVLHPALAEDQAFLRRFRSEAQLAASLHHPNVMSVYDWGEDDVPFMVLELLSGGSMRAMLDAEVKFTPAQAAHVGQQVCDALEYAHERGLVHRDIKPANLLFDEHGVVRVADFGLARALAEASWTEPTGAVVGTARYAAPEQASGATPDPRTDLYSLALVLVESVTGMVPLVGDTLVGTLAMRQDQAITAPSVLGPLGAVVERAGQPVPDDRYPDAQTMRAALSDAANALPKPGPLILAGMGKEIQDPHPTQIGRDRKEVFDQDAAELKVVLQDVDAFKRRQRVAQSQKVVAWVVGVFIALGLLGGAVFLAPFPASGKLAAVPNMVGQTQEEATALADDAGFAIRIERRSANDKAGLVIAQLPRAGSWQRGGTVTFVVSSGPEPETIPDVAGQSAADARGALEDMGYVVQEIRRFDETVPKDVVLGTEPAQGEKLAPESTIKLIVSDGPAPIPVPDVAGKSYDEAVAALSTAGLGATRVDEYSDEVEVGRVVRTEPAIGQPAGRGSAVKIVVSRGPELLDVPNVVGMSVESAAQQLEAAGFKADVQNFSPGKKVRAQDPQSGTKSRRGTEVTLFL